MLYILVMKEFIGIETNRFCQVNSFCGHFHRDLNRPVFSMTWRKQASSNQKRWLRHLLRRSGNRIDDRRASYAVRYSPGDKRARVEDITLEGMHLRVVSPPKADGLLPTLIYYHGGCFVSGGFATHDNQLRQLAMFSGCRGDRRAVSSGPGVPFSGGAR